MLNNSQLTTASRFKTPADEFFHNEILKISSGIGEIGGIVWPLFWCNLLSWIVVFLCIMNGVKSVGKVVYFTATFPFLILGILFIRGITLPGAMDGIKFYLMPDWGQLLNLRVWADASVQIFFSLGPGWGGIINMASYNDFRNNAKGDAILLPIINCGTSIFAGLVVFSVLGYMSHQTGLPVSSVVAGGPGLAFVTYPEAIGMMPFPQLWAGLFFSMLYFLGMDTCFVQIEAIISSIIDVFPALRSHKRKVTFISIIIMFLGSILCVTSGGMYVLQLLDWYSCSISVILICFVEVNIVGRLYGLKHFVRDVEFMINRKIERYWIICWQYATPAVLVFIFFTSIIFNTEANYNGMAYPRWAIGLGWASSLVSIICIPTYAIYRLLRLKEPLKQRLQLSLRSINWEPAAEDNKNAWEEFNKTLICDILN